MAIHLDLLYTTLDAAVNTRRTLDVLDVSSAMGGVTKSDCKLAKSISKNIELEHGARLLAALFLVSDASGAASAVKKADLSNAPSPPADTAVVALNFLKVCDNYTRAEGIRRLAHVMCDIPTVSLLRAFDKDQLIALRDLIGFASVSGIIDDPDASVSSVASNLKAVGHDVQGSD